MASLAHLPRPWAAAGITRLAHSRVRLLLHPPVRASLLVAVVASSISLYITDAKRSGPCGPSSNDIERSRGGSRHALPYRLPFWYELMRQDSLLLSRLSRDQSDLTSRGANLSANSDYSIVDEKVRPTGRSAARSRGLCPLRLKARHSFGTAALYFTCFASGAARSTGKRLAKICLRLDCNRLPCGKVSREFEGICQPGPFGLGLLDFLRNPPASCSLPSLPTLSSSCATPSCACDCGGDRPPRRLPPCLSGDAPTPCSSSSQAALRVPERLCGLTCRDLGCPAQRPAHLTFPSPLAAHTH